MTVPPINVDDLVAIDVHTHAEVSSRGQGSLSAELAVRPKILKENAARLLVLAKD